MNQPDKGLAAFIQARLRNLSKATGQNVDDLLYYFAIERFLYRLAQSSYCRNFILKGAFVFLAWGIPLGRPTRDIDLRGYVENSVEHLVEVMKEICSQPVEPDGVFFDPDSVTGQSIIQAADYQGVRIGFIGRLGKSRIRMQIDTGFSDVITPDPMLLRFPTLLGMPAPELRGYPPETVIAEKLQSMIYLGEINSRMKDFYDLWVLSQRFDFEGTTLQKAIMRTFEARNASIPIEVPMALTDPFALEKQTMWTRFLRKFSGDENTTGEFQDIIRILREFLLQPIQAAAQGVIFNARWNSRRGWY